MSEEKDTKKDEAVEAAKPEKKEVTKSEKKPEAQVVDKTKPVTKGKKPMPTPLKIALIVGGAIAAFFIVMIVIALVATGNASKTSDEFLNAMQAGDGTTAYSYFSSQAKEQVPEDEFVALVAQIGPILNTEERTTSKEVTKDDGVDSAYVEYEIDATDGITYVLGVNLVKEDGEWKVLNFDSEVKE